MALVIAQSSCSAAGPVTSRTSSARNRFLPEGIEQQPFDVGAQALDVDAGALRDQTRRSRVDLGARRGDARADPPLGVGQVLKHTALDDRRVLLQQLVHPAALVDAVAATSTSVVCGSGCLMKASSWSSARVAASLSRLGISSVSAWRTVTTRRGAIIGSVRAAAISEATPSASRSPVVKSPACTRSTLKA